MAPDLAYAFFRNPYEYGTFNVDLDRFARLINGQLRPRPKRVTRTTSAEDLLALARRSPFLSYDCESRPNGERHTGLDPTRAGLRMLGIGNPDEGLSYHWDDKVPSCERALKKILEDKKKLKVAMNERWFDDRLLARYDIRPVNVMGIREMRRSLSSTSPLSLAYQASIYDDAPPWKEGEEDDETGIVFTDDVDRLAEYCSIDNVEQARVYEGLLQEEEWNTPRVQRLYEVHREIARIAAEMHSNGFLVDEQQRQFMAFCLNQERREKVRALRKFLGLPKSWTPNPNAMRRLIYKKYAVAGEKSFNLPDPEDPKMWKEDGISVDKNTLIKVIIDPQTPPELKQAIEMYWAAEQPQKWVSTFLIGKNVQNAIGADGRLRAGWNSAGTDTMRWSCSKPNLMNLPQILRAMYRASKGGVLVHADKSQLELRMMAVVAGDDALQHNLDTGDVYSEDAKEWFKLPRDADVKKEFPKQRKASKIIHLGKQYGASDKTVWAQALRQDRGMKWAGTVLLCRGFDKTYAKTLAYWEREMKRVRACGYSEGRLLGSRRTYPREPELAEVANYPIQTTAAEMMNLELIALDRSLKKHVPSAKLIVQLHDAFDVDCPARHQGVVQRIMNDIMSQPYTIEGRTHTFPVEIKTGTHWDEV